MAEQTEANEAAGKPVQVEGVTGLARVYWQDLLPALARFCGYDEQEMRRAMLIDFLRKHGAHRLASPIARVAHALDIARWLDE